MKLIIDIPEDVYTRLFDNGIQDNEIAVDDVCEMARALRMGIPYAERPQGEWEESHIFSCGKILRMQLDVIEHKCRNCGRWSIKWVRSIPDNFCPNCGAEMRGKEE